MEGVRPATAADAQVCARLCARALEELAELRGGPLYARRETGTLAKALLRPGGLHRLIDDPLRRVNVGTLDDVAVGLALGHIEDVGEAKLGVLDGFYVEPDARGVGVGGLLVRSMVSWFSAARCRGVDANALPGDRCTKGLLEAAGFKARLITLHLPVS